MKIIDITHNWRKYKSDLCRLEKENFGKDAWTCKRLCDALPHSKFIIIGMDDEVVTSYAAVELDGGAIGGYYIWTIAVNSAYRNKGWGRLLMNYIITVTDGNRIGLIVREDNNAAIHLYKSCGFNSYGIMPNEYVDGCTGILMEYLPDVKNYDKKIS